MIKKPMKAPGEGVSLEILKAMPYPIACSAKLDGIRALVMPSGVMSATLKPLGNLYMQKCLNDPMLLGLYLMISHLQLVLINIDGLTT
jgi:hypothetical protein